MHELVPNFVTLVSMQEVEIPPAAAVVAKLPGGAVYLFVTWIIV